MVRNGKYPLYKVSTSIDFGTAFYLSDDFMLAFCYNGEIAEVFGVHYVKDMVPM